VANPFYLPFERPIVELEAKLKELKSASEENPDIDVSKEIERMERKIGQMRTKVYGNLSAWDKVQLARHPLRPYTRDYIGAISEDFCELYGDRLYSDDRAIVGGFATIDGRRLMLIGTQKGRDTKSNLECNFGSPYPEGYRKALRLMKLADKFNLPVITMIDTPGAFPGIESEERHVAIAIAVNLRDSFLFKVPILAIVTGEGGSGGALGISVANRILVLENAYYSVITPEGCAAILWKNREYAERAAAALKLTAQDLLESGISDGIIKEPLGGAHNDPKAAADALKVALIKNLDELSALTPVEIRAARYDKFRALGRFEEEIVTEVAATEVVAEAAKEKKKARRRSPENA
jgi:acetyl-CoA carboxylase carboxyl transferase subunit alpha